MGRLGAEMPVACLLESDLVFLTEACFDIRLIGWIHKYGPCGYFRKGRFF